MTDSADPRIGDDEKMPLGEETVVLAATTADGIESRISVHKQLLIAHSDFCKQVLQIDSAEGAKRKSYSKALEDFRQRKQAKTIDLEQEIEFMKKEAAEEKRRREYYEKDPHVKVFGLFRGGALGQAQAFKSFVVISLPDHTFDSIERYVQYLYSGKIRARPKSACHPSHFPKADGESICTLCKLGDEDEGYKILCELFFLEEKLRDDEFSNAVIDGIIALSQEVTLKGLKPLPMPEVMKGVYEKDSPARSRLRRLLVDMFISSKPALGPQGFGWPAPFLRDLAEGAMGRLERNEGLPLVDGSNRCEYHKHKWGEKCTSKKRKRADEDDED